MTLSLAAYCLDFRKEPPVRGQIFRLTRARQAESGPVRRIMFASERLRRWGQLHLDSDPQNYYHSMLQWAIWTREQRFTEDSFATALVDWMQAN